MQIVDLPKNLEKKLSTLAKKTGRSRAFHTLELITYFIDDLEDLYIAQRRQKNPGKTIPHEKIVADFKRRRKKPGA